MFVNKHLTHLIYLGCIYNGVTREERSKKLKGVIMFTKSISIISINQVCSGKTVTEKSRRTCGKKRVLIVVGI